MLNRVRNNPAQTAIRHVERLGCDPRQVRHIVLTHAHLDHAGGLPDFPWAKVHLLAAEHTAAMHPVGWMERFGYASEDWAHGPDWQLHTLQGERWLGLEAVRVLEEPSFWLVPLAGHSRGHCGVAVETPTGWMLHCGDAFLRGFQVDPVSPHSLVPAWSQPLIGLFERRMCPAETLGKVQKILHQHGDVVQVFCAHDPGADLGGIAGQVVDF
jgi:glyoxylase-like metal-dependent hydrolase (beta-lactamase superfamily II)